MILRDALLNADYHANDTLKVDGSAEVNDSSTAADYFQEINACTDVTFFGLWASFC